MHRLKLEDWLAEEMFTGYGAARKLTTKWLNEGRIILLLDGLDEVAEPEGCLDAINAFKQEFPAKMVVCRRTEDYEQLKGKLSLATALEIQQVAYRKRKRVTVAWQRNGSKATATGLQKPGRAGGCIGRVFLSSKCVRAAFRMCDLRRFMICLQLKTDGRKSRKA